MDAPMNQSPMTTGYGQTGCTTIFKSKTYHKSK